MVDVAAVNHAKVGEVTPSTVKLYEYVKLQAGV